MPSSYSKSLSIDIEQPSRGRRHKNQGLWNTPSLFRSMSTDRDASSINNLAPLYHSSRAQEQVHKPSSQYGSDWAIGKLRKLGYYHPAEPSHVCFSKSQLGRTLARLKDCLRALSCHVLYETNECGAECQTMDRIHFQITFFEKDPQTILFEIQRRAGDSFVFHCQYTRPILAAIRGSQLSSLHSQSTDCNMAVSIDHLAIAASEEEVSEAIELAANMISTDRLDACQLGMESLAVLTDTTKTGLSTARKVAHALLMPAEGKSSKLVQILLRYLLDRKESDLTYYALKVWSNVWQIAAGDDETHLDAFCNTVCPASTLVCSLANRIDHVHEHPHEATLALLGLSALCHEMPQLRIVVPRSCVEEAKAMGAFEHAALEQASRLYLEGH